MQTHRLACFDASMLPGEGETHLASEVTGHVAVAELGSKSRELKGTCKALARCQIFKVAAAYCLSFGAPRRRDAFCPPNPGTVASDRALLGGLGASHVQVS